MACQQSLDSRCKDWEFFCTAIRPQPLAWASLIAAMTADRGHRAGYHLSRLAPLASAGGASASTRAAMRRFSARANRLPAGIAGMSADTWRNAVR
jgi:hypothetical protein